MKFEGYFQQQFLVHEIQVNAYNVGLLDSH